MSDFYVRIPRLVSKERQQSTLRMRGLRIAYRMFHFAASRPTISFNGPPWYASAE